MIEAFTQFRLTFTQLIDTGKGSDYLALAKNLIMELDTKADIKQEILLPVDRTAADTVFGVVETEDIQVIITTSSFSLVKNHDPQATTSDIVKYLGNQVTVMKKLLAPESSPLHQYINEELAVAEAIMGGILIQKSYSDVIAYIRERSFTQNDISLGDAGFIFAYNVNSDIKGVSSERFNYSAITNIATQQTGVRVEYALVNGGINHQTKSQEAMGVKELEDYAQGVQSPKVLAKAKDLYEWKKTAL